MGFLHHKRAMKTFCWPSQSWRGTVNTDTQFRVWALGDSRSRRRSRSGDHLQHPRSFPAPFKMDRLLKKRRNKTSLSHPNMLICAVDNISEVLINQVFSDDDLLCCGFNLILFFSLSVCRHFLITFLQVL